MPIKPFIFSLGLGSLLSFIMIFQTMLSEYAEDGMNSVLQSKGLQDMIFESSPIYKSSSQSVEWFIDDPELVSSIDAYINYHPRRNH